MTHSANPWGLTDREAQVMDGILQHGCQKLVAREMGIAVATVQTYAERIRQKMGVGGHRLWHILRWYDFRKAAT